MADWPIQLDTCHIRKPRHVRKLSSVTDGSRRNAYLLKIGAKSVRDGSQGICNDTESNLGNSPEASVISVSVLNNSRRIIMSSS